MSEQNQDLIYALKRLLDSLHNEKGNIKIIDEEIDLAVINAITAIKNANKLDQK